MSTTRPAYHLTRIAPTLLALGMMGSSLQAADPVVKTIGVSAATTTPASATFSVEFDTDVWGWDPVIGTELIVYQSASATAGGVTAGEKVTLTTANITSVTSKKFEFSTPAVAFSAALPYVWVEIPINVAGKNNAPGGATLPASVVGPILVYTMVGTTGAQAASTTANQITGPIAKSSTTNRTFNVTAQVNIVDDEAASSPAAINAAFGVTDDFILQIKDGSTVIGSQKFRKPTITPASGTTNRQLVQAVIDAPFTVGVHSLTALVIDPIGRTASTSAAAPVLVWDAPVLVEVNGLRAPESTPTVFTIDRTNAIDMVGSNFTVGAFTSTVTAVMDPSTTATALTDSSTDPTQFKFSLASLPQGSHTIEITQTYTGTPSISPAPTLVRSYTINNSTAVLDVVAPTVVIATPANNSTVAFQKPTVSGITEANATVSARYSTDGASWTSLTDVTADAAGNYSFGTAQWGANLAVNTSYFIQVRATDKAGNVLPWADFTATNPPGQSRVTTASAGVNVALGTPTNLTGSGAIKFSTAANPTFPLTLTSFTNGAITSGTVPTTAPDSLLGTDFVVTGGTAAVTGTIAGYTLTITPSAQGNVTVSLPKNSFTVDGTPNEALPTYTFIRDNVAPILTAKVVGQGTSTTSINLATGTKIVLTATEDIDAATLDKTKITIAGLVGAVAATGYTAPTLNAGTLSADKRTITFTTTSAIVPGTATSISVTVAAGVAKDLAGNNAPLITAFTSTLDLGAITLDITSITSTALTPAGKLSPMPFTLTFSKPVNDFGLEDLDITNGIATTLTGAGTAVYTLTVVPGEGPTPVKVAIKSGTIVKDLVGTALTISGTTNGKHVLTRVYDSTPPSVLSLTSSTPAPTATDLKPTNLTSIPCTIVFSEPLAAALKASDLTVSGGSVSSVSGDGSVFSFNVDVSPANDAHKVSVLLPEKKVSDSVANQNSSVAVLVRNFDRDLPVITASAPVPTGSTTTSESKAAFAFTITGNAGGTTDSLLSTFDKSKISMSPAVGSIESITTTDDGATPAKITGFTVNVIYQRNTGSNVIVTAAPGTITDRAGNKNVSVASTLANPSNG
jgi:hypothetical protein